MISLVVLEYFLWPINLTLVFFSHLPLHLFVINLILLLKPSVLFEFLSMQIFFFSNNGIEFQQFCVYTPQQNGFVERKHHHILQIACALHFHSHLPITFWGECVLTAIYLINRLPTPLLSNQTPFELLYNRPPSFDHLHAFGCLCHSTIVQPLHKFDSRAWRCIFVGYPTDQKGNKLYDLDSLKKFVGRDIRFH